MLLCAGCGADVSPWAARCSRCGRPGEDAVEVVPVATVEPADSGDDAPQTGALTADPRQPTWLRRHLRVALAGAALVVGLAAVLSWQLAAGGGKPQAVPGAHGLSGHILSSTGEQRTWPPPPTAATGYAGTSDCTTANGVFSCWPSSVSSIPGPEPERTGECTRFSPTSADRWGSWPCPNRSPTRSEP